MTDLTPKRRKHRKRLRYLIVCLDDGVVLGTYHKLKTARKDLKTCGTCERIVKEV